MTPPMNAPMDAKKAREIVKQFDDALYIFEKVHPNAKAFLLAKGYLIGLEGREFAALTSRLKVAEEALKRFELWDRQVASDLTSAALGEDLKITALSAMQNALSLLRQPLEDDGK